jgi:ribonuclease HI
MENYAAQPDLTDQPLKNPDLNLYTDGSSFVKNGVRHEGFAVVTEFGIIKSGPLPPNTSAQLAELVALTEALSLSKEQKVNIYTDSKYAFLILHAHVTIWKERKMLTTTGSPIRHSCDIVAFLDAVLLPKEVLVIHCKGHQKGEDKTAKGNKAADEVAKWAAMRYIAGHLLWERTLLAPERPHYPSEESSQALDQGYQLDHQGWWVSPRGKLWLPEALQWKIFKTLYQVYHLGLDNTLVLVNKMFGGTKLRDIAQQVLQGCEIWQKKKSQ